MTDLMEKLIASGYPRNEMAHHESDLYVFVTANTTKVIREWCEENGLDMDYHCSTFIDNVTGKPMYDCAFCYSE